MTQHSKFSETALEQAIIELLGKEGYPYVKGDTITREPGQVLLHADLRAFLAKQYAADHITPQEIEAVIKQLEAYSAADLYEGNKAIMKLVSDVDIRRWIATRFTRRSSSRRKTLRSIRLRHDRQPQSP